MAGIKAVLGLDYHSVAGLPELFTKTTISHQDQNAKNQLNGYR